MSSNISRVASRQALRGGNIVDATYIEDALTNAWENENGGIRWKYPLRVVFPAIWRPSYAFLDWEKPAPAMQVNTTTMKMGMMAGVIGCIRAHD